MDFRFMVTSIIGKFVPSPDVHIVYRGAFPPLTPEISVMGLPGKHGFIGCSPQLPGS